MKYPQAVVEFSDFLNEPPSHEEKRTVRDYRHEAYAKWVLALDAMITQINEAVKAERERCAKLVPTNWCDELLTGKDAPKGPLDNRGVEKLLRGIQDRIRADTRL